MLVVVVAAGWAWAHVPDLYPTPATPADRPEVAAAREATRSQAIVTTRASVLAALAGLGALATILINSVNSRTQAATLRETARSYAKAEADRARDIAHREAAARDVREDAQERRVTELYTAASEQLGSERAPVRLAGLYALERLAQSTPGQRQTIVNVWCAYLRMPYTPPPETDDGETASLEVGQAREEREVRVTAQRLLATHLRPGDDPDHPVDSYWPEVVELDLAGAHLHDFNLDCCRLPSATSFGGASFTGGAEFNGASFVGKAWFEGASFARDAGFEGASVAGGAWFNGASFARRAWFVRASFAGKARFYRASFTQAEFSGVSFADDATFVEARFAWTSSFNNATFTGAAWFERASFAHEAWFDGTRFAGTAAFTEASFAGDTTFIQASFPGNGDVRCGKARARAGDHVWPGNWLLSEEVDEDGYHQLVQVREGGDR